MTLLNDKQIHQVILRLDKNIPRERSFREFLDNATSNGINRKEAILRIFEEYSDSDPFKINREAKEMKAEDGDKEIQVVRANKEVTDVSAFDE